MVEKKALTFGASNQLTYLDVLGCKVVLGLEKQHKEVGIRVLITLFVFNHDDAKFKFKPANGLFLNYSNHAFTSEHGSCNFTRKREAFEDARNNHTNTRGTTLWSSLGPQRKDIQSHV